MISVEEAHDRITSGLSPLPAETVALRQAAGRVLAEKPSARLNQPWADISAMDGYAVRAADVATLPTALTVSAEASAGGSTPPPVSPGCAVRIFTGAPVPAGADLIVVQEDTERVDDQVVIRDAPPVGKHIRRKGMDFTIGDMPLEIGHRLGARHIGLAAAMNHPWLRVHRRPRVAILATGDEIVLPGEPVGENQIVSSNALMLTGLIEAEGAEVIDLGVARDDRDHLSMLAAGAEGADMLVTTGGASVGDHDLVRDALGDQGLTLDFWKIAMRPGKPLMFGKAGQTPLLGLPGNPVSSFVCALLFLRPALWKLSGSHDRLARPTTEQAVTRTDLPKNDQRQDYVRSVLGEDGLVAPLPVQDSAHMTGLTAANALIVRPPYAPELSAGSTVQVIPFD